MVPPSVASLAGQGLVMFQVGTTAVTSNQNVAVRASFRGITVQDTVTITPGPPSITVPGSQLVYPGKLLSFAVTVTDPAGLAVSLSLFGLPPNASFNPATRVFTWVPEQSQIGMYRVQFTATNLAKVSATQEVVIEVASTTPVVFSLSNAASWVEVGCSPGTVATLLGTGFVKAAPQAAASSPLPNQLNGLEVQTNGDPMPVFYAAENQVNFQCPQLPPGTPVSLLIQSVTGSSTPLSFTMEFATPGIFALDGSGKGQGAILIANSNKVAMETAKGIPSQPATPGGYVSIYAAGLGPTDFQVQPGKPAPVDRLVRATASVDVLIDGQNANVTFAGLAPGFIGLYQVNAQVPESSSVGDAIPVQISVHLPDGSVVTSNVVTIAVEAPAN